MSVEKSNHTHNAKCSADCKLNAKQDHENFSQKVEEAKKDMQDAKEKAQQGINDAQKDANGENVSKSSTSEKVSLSEPQVKQVTTEHEVKIVQGDENNDDTIVVNKAGKTAGQLQRAGLDNKDDKPERKIALPGSSHESVSLVDAAAKQN